LLNCWARRKIAAPPAQGRYSMYCDLIHCKNCGHDSAFRASTPESPDIGLESSQTENDLLAVACPVCKHVYDYSDQRPKNIPTPWGELGSRMKTPMLFPVPLLCAEESCGLPLLVIAARGADTTWPEVQSELSTWTLHDLKCPNGHPITAIRR
jgi:hypothetical protein